MTKLFPVRDRPRRITLARTTDPALTGNVLGELQWRIYFDLWKVPHGAEAAAGWGGDRDAVTRGRDGRLIGWIATVWDTAEDARQFADAHAASLAARFPDGGPLAAGIARPDDGSGVRSRRRGSVFIADGASALDALVKSTKLDRDNGHLSTGLGISRRRGSGCKVRSWSSHMQHRAASPGVGSA